MADVYRKDLQNIMEEKTIGVARWAIKTYGLSPVFEPLFVSQMYAESGMDPDAVSKDGAQGLGQLMWEAVVDAKKFMKEPDFVDYYPKDHPKGSGVGLPVPTDPDENLRIAAAYNARNYKQFGNDQHETVMAAYNAGPTIVSNKGAAWVIKNYPETRGYIKTIFSDANVQKAISLSTPHLDPSDPEFVGPPAPNSGMAASGSPGTGQAVKRPVQSRSPTVQPDLVEDVVQKPSFFAQQNDPTAVPLPPVAPSAPSAPTPEIARIFPPGGQNLSPQELNLLGELQRKAEAKRGVHN